MVLPTLCSMRGVSRWVGFIIDCFLAITFGAQWFYVVFVDRFKQLYGFSIPEAQWIGVAMYAFGCSSFIGGHIYDTKGPRPTGAVGLLLTTVGYLCLWNCSLSDTVINLPTNIVAVSIYGAIAAQGSIWGFTAAVSRTAKSFPDKYSGMALSAVLAFYGLAQGIASIVYSSAFGNNLPSYLLFFLMLQAVSCLLAMTCSADESPLPPNEVRLTKLFTITLNMAFAIGGVIAISALLLAVANVSIIGKSRLLGIIVMVSVATLAVPLFLLKAPLLKRNPGADSGSESPKMFLRVYPGLSIDQERPPQNPTNLVEQSHGILVVLKKLDMWLIFLIAVLIYGNDSTLKTSLTSWCLSMSKACKDCEYSSVEDIPDFNPSMVSILVALEGFLSTSTCAVFGYLIDRIKSIFKLSFLFVFLAGFQLFLFTMCLLIKQPWVPYAIYPCLGCIGGGLWLVGPAYCRRRYGEKTFGACTSFLYSAAPVGCVLFGPLMQLVNSETSKSSFLVQGSAYCIGSKCYRNIFFALMGFGLAQTALALGICAQIYFTSPSRKESSPKGTMVVPSPDEGADGLPEPKLIPTVELTDF